MPRHRTKQPRFMRLNSSIVVIGFVLIYLSKIIWYDLRIYAARGTIGEVNTGLYFILWAACILPFICYFILKIPRSDFRRPIIIFYIVVVMLSTIVGLANANPIQEILGDLYKSAFIPAGVGLYSFCQRRNIDLKATLYVVISIYVVLRFTIYYSFVDTIRRLYYGVIYDSIFIGLLFSDLKSRSRFVTFVFQRKFRAILWILVILGQKRFVLGSMIAFLGLKFRAWVTVSLFLAASAILLAYGNDILEAVSTTRIGRNLSVAEILESEYRRYAEIQAGIQLWSSSLFSILFGHGFGASIEIYSPQDQYWVEVFSIHNSQTATLVRSGLAGLFLMFYLVSYAVRGLSVESCRLESAILLSILFSSLIIYTFMDEVLVGYFLAAIWDRSSAKRATLNL